MRIAVNGVHLNAEWYGHKQHPPLVLLHGFTGSTATWRPLFAGLARYQLRLIALDMLGHGASDVPADPERYRMEHCLEDILAVLRTLGIREGEAALLGYSMGGRIALYCAFSGFFRAVILESASPGLADPQARIERQRSDEALAERIEREGVPAFVNYWERLPLFASQQSLSEARQQALRAQRLQNSALGLANSLRGVGTGVQPALHERLSSLTIPALLLTGELDTKFCTIAEMMAGRLPRVEWQRVAGAGHAIHLERPEAYNQYVGQFCTKVLR